MGRPIYIWRLAPTGESKWHNWLCIWQQAVPWDKCHDVFGDSQRDNDLWWLSTVGEHSQHPVPERLPRPAEVSSTAHPEAAGWHTAWPQSTACSRGDAQALFHLLLSALSTPDSWEGRGPSEGLLSAVRSHMLVRAPLWCYGQAQPVQHNPEATKGTGNFAEHSTPACLSWEYSGQ